MRRQEGGYISVGETTVSSKLPSGPTPGARSVPDQELSPVQLRAVRDFLVALGFTDQDVSRCRRIRVEPGVIQVTLMSHNEQGKYFIDPTTGRVAEEHYVMPVVGS